MEAHPRRRVEHEPQLGLRDRQQLAGPDEERHAGPAPVVDLQAHGGVRLGRGVGLDPVDVAVAVVLAADVVRGIGVGHRVEQRVQRVLERCRIAAGGRLDRGRGDDLHEVVDDDVAQGADGVVEVAAIGDAEALGHRDLHRRDVVAVPHGLEQGVREPQVERLGDAHLPEEVVDPVQLGLVEVLVHVVVELPRGREVVPEGLLDDDAGVLDEAGSGEPLHDRPEQERRDLEVVDRAPAAVEHSGEALERLGIGEVAGDVGHPRREAREHLLVDRLPGSLDRAARVRAQVLEGPVVDRDADDRTGQQAASLQAVQRPERHDLREVAGDAEGDEHVGRLLRGCCIARSAVTAVVIDGRCSPLTATRSITRCV